MTDVERDARILTLWRKGLTQQIIADRFGIRQRGVSAAIKRAEKRERAVQL